jgi:hypothetical protein
MGIIGWEQPVVHTRVILPFCPNPRSAIGHPHLDKSCGRSKAGHDDEWKAKNYDEPNI